MTQNETEPSSRVIPYLRISTGTQDLINTQKLELHEYARRNDIKINDFIEVEISSRKSTKERKIDKLLENLQAGDLLLVSEFSRLGRSVGQIIQIVDALIKMQVRLVAVKQSIKINGKQNIQTKTMITMFGLFAEIERNLISQRTKQGLAVARKSGKILRRPKGSGKSKLDEFKPEIEALLKNGSSKTFVAKRYCTSLPNLYKWMKKKRTTLETDNLNPIKDFVQMFNYAPLHVVIEVIKEEIKDDKGHELHKKYLAEYVKACMWKPTYLPHRRV